MFFRRVVAISLFAAATCASPRPQENTTSCTKYGYGYGISSSSSSSATSDGTVTTIVTLTDTVTASASSNSAVSSSTSSTSDTTTDTTTSSTSSSTDTTSDTSTSTSTTSSSTSASAITTPTAYIEVVAAHSGSPIHLMPMNAAGLRFYLGGGPVTYCPSSVEETGDCPPGTETVFSLCSMAVVVPGGQQIYVTPGGEIRYTQAHSAFMPNGSIACPFTYYKPAGGTIGHLSTNSFGARGLMACPTDGGLWQVFADLRNATVPQGNVSQCVGFDALSLDAPVSAAAWQYT